MVTVQGYTKNLLNQIVPFRKVTIKLTDVNGKQTTAAVAGEVLTFIVEAESDVNGFFEVELFPNDLIVSKFTKYEVSIEGAPKFFTYVQDTTSVTQIDELISDFPIVIPELPGATGDAGPQGTSVDHIVLTNTIGLEKTYTAYADIAETIILGTFTLLDGQQGIQGIQGIAGKDIDHISLFQTVGLEDTYRVWGDAEETILFGDFIVINGVAYDDTQVVSDVADNTNSINAVIEAIANLASAQGKIENATNPAVAPIPVAPATTILDFATNIASTDTSVFEFDDVANTITFKKKGSYNFNSSVTLESSTGQTRIINFGLIDVSDDSIVTSQPATVEVPNGKKANFPLNTLVVVDTVPLTVRIDASADGTGYSLDSFDSVLVSMVNVIAELPTDILRNGDIGVSVQPYSLTTIEKSSALTLSNIDISTGNVFHKTISGATTLTVSGAMVAEEVHSFILELENASTNITWWTGIKWAGGTPPELTAVGIDLLGFYTRDAGVTWRGNILSLDSK